MPASYRDLKVWQDAMSLTVSMYAATAQFPKEERYGIAQQMRRAAVSIPSNIAEGYGRQTSRQRYSFLENAMGSLFELETQTELCSRLGFLDDGEAHDLSDTIRNLGRGLAALMKYVQDEAQQEKKRYT
jgi:four helix bundle protein